MEVIDMIIFYGFEVVLFESIAWKVNQAVRGARA